MPGRITATRLTNGRVVHTFFVADVEPHDSIHTGSAAILGTTCPSRLMADSRPWYTKLASSFCDTALRQNFTILTKERFLYAFPDGAIDHQ